MTAYPPGPTNAREAWHKFQANPLAFFQELAETYGEIAYVRLATRHMYLICGPEILRYVLVEQADKFEKTDHTKDSLAPLGNGLLVSSGDYHDRHRRIIHPIFTPAWLANYVPTIVEDTLRTIVPWQAGETRDIADDMMRLALDIVCKTIFGGAGVQSDIIAKSAAVWQRFAADGLRRSKLTNVTEEQLKEASESLDKVVRDVLAQGKNRNGQDLVSLMANAVDPDTHTKLSEKEIRDEALTFLMAGHETTANALTWTWYLLAKHPHVEARLLDEIDRVLGDRAPTIADIPHLTYTEMVLKESLRLYPPAWLIGRTPIAPTDVAGYTIIPGATLTICPYVFHRNPQYFPEPESFNPERFSRENEKQIPRYAYLPFSAGPRVCIGQPFAMLETSLVLVTIAQRFQLQIPADYVAEPDPQITLRPKGGLKVTLAKRPEKSENRPVYAEAR